MSKTYSATIIGGGSAGHLSLKAMLASDRFEPLAVADINTDARQAIAAEYPGIRTFASHEEMFRECPADIVVVATFPPSHLPLTLAALEQPLQGIVVEKPLGDTADAGRQLLRAVKDAGLPIAVPHGLLVSPHAAEIIQRVHNGEIGALQSVDIRCSKWDILSAGIHWLNFFVVLTRADPVEYVLAACDTSTRTFRDGVQVETLAATYAQTRSGVRVAMNTGDEVNTGRDGKFLMFNLVGSDGIIEFYGWENTYRLLNAEHPTGRTFSAPEDGRTRHQAHLENLAAQMDAGQPDYDIAESSLTALEIVEGAYISHRHRCRVSLPLSDFEPPAANDWDPGRPYAGSGGGRDGRKL